MLNLVEGIIESLPGPTPSLSICTNITPTRERIKYQVCFTRFLNLLGLRTECHKYADLGTYCLLRISRLNHECTWHRRIAMQDLDDCDDENLSKNAQNTYSEVHAIYNVIIAVVGFHFDVRIS